MTFFTNYPGILYTLTDETGEKKTYTLVDITSRVKLNMSDKQKRLMTQSYTISDGDTPELVSMRVYGTPDYHWIIMHVNEIHDYIGDWCMNATALLSVCREKYGSNIDAIRFYRDSTGSVVMNPSAPFFVSSGGVSGFSGYQGTDSLVAVTNFEYETEQNEAKRDIRLVRPEYVRDYIQLYNEALKRTIS